MQLAQETMKSINGMVINYEAHAMDKEEMRARLVESENVRHLLYEEVRRMAGEITRMNVIVRVISEEKANLRLSYDNMCSDIQDLNAYESTEAASTIQNLQEAVAKLEEDKKTDAALYAIAMRSINMMHERIAKLEHRCSGLKGSITKKKKIILQLRQAIHVNGA